MLLLIWTNFSSPKSSSTLISVCSMFFYCNIVHPFVIIVCTIYHDIIEDLYSSIQSFTSFLCSYSLLYSSICLEFPFNSLYLLLLLGSFFTCHFMKFSNISIIFVIKIVNKFLIMKIRKEFVII